MKTLARWTFAVIAAAATLVASASDPIKIARAVKEGVVLRQDVDLKLTVMGSIEGRAVGILKLNPTKVEDKHIDWTASWDKLDVTVNEAPWPIEEIPTAQIRSKLDGTLLTFTGGLEQIDLKRLYFAITFLGPDKAVSPGDTYERKLEKVEAEGIPAMALKGKYVGPDKVGEIEAHRFDVSVEELDGDGFKSEGSYWVTAEGVLLKLTVKIKSLPIPAAGAYADGTVELTHKP
jgi:hypothetical protein